MVKSLILSVVLFLTACVTPQVSLDTNNKKLLAAEIAYSETAQLALNSRDRMSASTRADVKDLLLKAHAALVLARQALDIGNELDFSNSLAAANSIIRTLRPILEAMEESSNVGFQYYSRA